tara:strand:- start:238 stop:462 length:225 start_codon:yes stop_codon:yes gene_type:complete
VRKGRQQTATIGHVGYRYDSKDPPFQEQSRVPGAMTTKKGIESVGRLAVPIILQGQGSLGIRNYRSPFDPPAAG